MGILLTAQGLHASFGARPLFEDVSFTVEDGDRIGLIGPNGAGKSTLLRLLASASDGEATTSGTVSKRRGLRIGFLEQTPAFAPEATIEDVVKGALPPGHWEDDAEAQVLLSKLSLAGQQPGIDPATPVAALSGGWRKRLALARELVRQPDLLLLDEPTNHLDVESIDWLEALLASSRFATITVTHDRFFLRRVANRILELDRRNAGGLLAVAGDFDHYVRVKAETMHAQERQEVVLRNTLRRETEWLRRGPAARTTKQQARIARAGELASEVAELGIRNAQRTAAIELQSSARQPRRLIEARDVEKRYGDRTIFSGVDLFISPGMRVALLGPNGCGKSTLIRVLLGEEPASAGTIRRADGLQVAYFAQGRETLRPDLTLVETVCPDGSDHVSYRGARVHARGYLERFLFAPDKMDVMVGKLSGGEQSRLLIAELMLRPAQVLVLDEPTNDLDLATLGVLEEALGQFDGAVLLVSHDRAFVDHVATSLLAFDTATRAVVPFADLSQWQAWRDSARSSGDATTGKPSPSGRAREDAERAPTPDPGRRRLGYLEQREYDAIEEKIAAAEAALAAAVSASEAPENASNAARLVELLAAVETERAEVDRLYARWAELESKLAPR